MAEWPEWWYWELELSPHLLKRMVDRQFNEIDLRSMFDHAEGYHPDVVLGRFIIRTRHDRVAWEAIVEPIADEKALMVITAYPIG